MSNFKLNKLRKNLFVVILIVLTISLGFNLYYIINNRNQNDSLKLQMLNWLESNANSAVVNQKKYKNPDLIIADFENDDNNFTFYNNTNSNISFNLNNTEKIQESSSLQLNFIDNPNFHSNEYFSINFQKKIDLSNYSGFFIGVKGDGTNNTLSFSFNFGSKKINTDRFFLNWTNWKWIHISFNSLLKENSSNLYYLKEFNMVTIFFEHFPNCDNESVFYIDYIRFVDHHYGSFQFETWRDKSEIFRGIRHSEGIYNLAYLYNCKNSNYYKSPRLKESVFLGLDYIFRRYYDQAKIGTNLTYYKSVITDNSNGDLEMRYEFGFVLLSILKAYIELENEDEMNQAIILDDIGLSRREWIRYLSISYFNWFERDQFSRPNYIRFAASNQLIDIAYSYYLFSKITKNDFYNQKSTLVLNKIIEVQYPFGLIPEGGNCSSSLNDSVIYYSTYFKVSLFKLCGFYLDSENNKILELIFGLENVVRNTLNPDGYLDSKNDTRGNCREDSTIDYPFLVLKVAAIHKLKNMYQGALIWINRNYFFDIRSDRYTTVYSVDSYRHYIFPKNINYKPPRFYENWDYIMVNSNNDTIRSGNVYNYWRNINEFPFIIPEI